MQRPRLQLVPICTAMLLVALLAVACGPEASTSTPIQPTATTVVAQATATNAGEQATAITAAPSSESGTLTVLDWAGYDAPDFWTDFKSMYPNVAVNFEIGASDADIYGKMKGGDQADLFHPYT